MPKPPDKPPKPDPHPDSVVISGSLNLTGIPPLPDDIKIHVPRNITVHHVFDTPLHVVLEIPPPTLTHIKLVLSTP